MDIFARLESLLNPEDPFYDFDATLIGEQIYLHPATGHTAGEMRGVITGKAFGMVEAGEKIKMTLISRTTGDVAAVVGTFRVGNVAITGDEIGSVLAITYRGTEAVAKSGSVQRAADDIIEIEAGLSWGVGIMPGTELPDSDQDGWPNSVDNCTKTANPGQQDTDGDRIGNACDPDFDGDNVVTQAEIDRISACVGVKTVPDVHFTEPESTYQPESDPAEAHGQAIACMMADLDGDGEVTSTDLETAEAFKDKHPGPSGFVITQEEPVVADPVPETGSDTSVINDTAAPLDTTSDDNGEETGGSGGGCTTGSTPSGALPLLITGILFVGLVVGRRKSFGEASH